MRILLINKNPVVSKLLSFAITNTKHTFTETENLDEIVYDHDLIILDDNLFNNDKCTAHENKPCIILSNKNSIDRFKDIKEQTILLQKPFMPELLLDAIESFETGMQTFFKNKNKNFKENESAKEVQNEASILNIDEIDKIQQLLNNESFEDDSKNNKDYINYVFDKNPKTKEKELIDAILGMKPKKLKKFLKNANVKLNIEIKEH